MTNLEMVIPNVAPDYKIYEKKIILKIQELFSSNFDGLMEIPFKKNCTLEELLEIEQDLNSCDLENIKKGVVNFIDLELFFKKEISIMNQIIKEEMIKRYLSVSEAFEKDLNYFLHKYLYDSCINKINYIFDQYINLENKMSK